MPETVVRPAHLWVPEHDSTAGPEAADLAELAGLVLDGEQRLVADAILAERSDGRWAAFETALVCPRQNMKTRLLQALVLADLFLHDARLVIWTAHLFDTAQEAFRDMVALVDSSEWLRRELAPNGIHRGRGDEGIELKSGARLNFLARSKTGGRGLSGDVVILDEAFALTPTEMGALLPTLSARPNPQVRYASSAGMPSSSVLRGLRERGRAGADPSLVWVEWCAENGCGTEDCAHERGTEGCALDDPARWQQANPAMGRRITAEHIAAERRSLDPAEFARERLGWWEDPLPPGVGGAFDLDTWAALRTAESPAVGPRAFGVAVAPDRTWSAVSVAHKRPDGLPQVEVVRYSPGTAWVAGFVADLTSRHDGTVTVDTPARGLIPDAEEPSSGDQSRAHVAFGDAVEAGRLRHLDEPALNVAVKAARWKPLGDTRVLDRKGTTDITPLVAAALALHGLTSQPAEFEPFMVVT